MTRTRPSRARTAILFSAIYVGGCHSKAADFYERVFPCDIAATEDVCGTTRDGQPMTCYSVSQLGGKDFCVPACDPNGAADAGPGAGAATSPDGSVCLAAGARVETCRPAAAASDPAAACPTGLSCYRTDLLHDEGLCLNTPVCKTSADCTDPARRLCEGDFFRSTYPGVPLLLDNLYCLQAGCKTTGTGCLSGESCLPIVVPQNNIPDICVPNCDAMMHCPPNFVCSFAVSGPVAPKVCLAGLPGGRCGGPEDCMVGTCEDTDVGFSVCTFPCEKDRDCVPLIGVQEEYVCAHRPSDGIGHCVSPEPFAGQPCFLKEHCPPGLDCYLYNPFMSKTSGECRLPCGPSDECPARGGVPHICLFDGDGAPAGCYPGRFGLRCADSSQCMAASAGFTCQAVTNELAPGGPTTEKVCTIPCADDADCDANPWTNHDGYCGGGYCQLGGGDGAHCERDAHCRTRLCQLAPAGNGTCLPDLQP